jgi:hypothetical protein
MRRMPCAFVPAVILQLLAELAPPLAELATNPQGRNDPSLGALCSLCWVLPAWDHFTPEDVPLDNSAGPAQQVQAICG